MNFWLFILSGVLGVANSLIVWLFGGPENYHQAIGFQNSLAPGVTVFFDVLFATLGNFNLTLPALAIAVFFPILFADTIIKIWLKIRAIFLFS